MMKCPAASVVALLVCEGETACTCAPAIGVPFVSLIVPAILPVTPASAHVSWPAKNASNVSAATSVRGNENRFMRVVSSSATLLEVNAVR